ncbi:MAG: type II secretion system F family protein [Ignisphaera sp.]|nr:type II secretion system F family protein [Ignisphaera sp.]MDW8084807.1 type II secretion system F family protein [Ignisphaera sp.]
MRSLNLLKEEFFEYAQVLIKPFYYLLNKINNSLKLNLDIYVVGSGISSSIERYFLVASWYTLAAMAMSVLTTLLYAHHVLKLSLFYLIILALLMVPLLTLLASIELVVILPKILFTNRGSIMESKAILLLTVLALLTTGGRGVQDIIHDIPRALGREYRYFSIEIDLVRSLTRLGMPLDVALKRTAEITPSMTVKELLSLLASVSNVGGDVSSTIKLELDRYIARYELGVEKAVESLNVYMEVHIALALLTPVLIGSIAVLTLLHPLAGISFEQIMFLSSFILLPITTAVVIVLADAIVSRIRP